MTPLKMINLNKISPKVLFLSNVIVIILLLLATAFLITEIIFVQKYGGQCVANPMGWAEKYAREEKGLIIDCSCKQIGDDFGEINITGGER